MEYAMIEVQGLCRRFGTTLAVNDISFDVPRGQVVGLLGPNGAGKTTTISMLTGMLPPTAGDATVYGNSIVEDMPGVRQDIGFCPQHDVLYSSLTVHEHLTMFASLKGIPDAEVEEVVGDRHADIGVGVGVNIDANRDAA